MGALDRLGSEFPPERGAFWFAAGVRFTSFVLVESIAVISVEVGNGLEVNLLGLSRLDLPTPATPMARLELALRARFSSRDAVLAIQAQLTDNSWIINESCRLTGGFAYVVWFRTGQFVLTLGGYHHRFQKPPEFPSVPRLGYAWQVSDILSIKGEAYFALTASCVMAGATVDASLDAGWVWGTLRGGFDALVRFDPFHYDVTGSLEVSGGFEIEICVRFLGCATISFDLSLTATLEVQGPELQGIARLDLGPASFPVRFGATGNTTRDHPLGWHEFYDKYLVAGDERRRALDAVVARGALAVPAGEKPDDGSAARPWKVLAEFELSTSTRAACTLVNGESAGGAAALPLGVGPMKVTRVRSEHRVGVVEPGGEERTEQLRVIPVIDSVPTAVWEVFDGTEPPAEARVRKAAVGARVVAEAQPVGAAVPLPVDDAEDDGLRHPLPFLVEQETRSELERVLSEAQQFLTAQPTETPAIFDRASLYLSTGRFRPTSLSALEQRAFVADRSAPPRLAPLTEGIVDPVKPPEPVTDRPPPEPEPPQDTTVAAPRLDAQLRIAPPGALGGAHRTTVDPGLVQAGRVERRQAPTLAQVEALLARTPVAARLVRTSPTARTIAVGSAAAASTIVAAALPPRTRLAGGLAERRRGLQADPAAAAALAEAEKQLLEGVTLRPGDVQIWRLPNSASDVIDPHAARPAIHVEGTQSTRIVVLDRAGGVLADLSGNELTLEVPVGTHRLVVVGEGTIGDGPAGASLSGWQVGTTVAQVNANVYVGPRSVITATAARARREGISVSVALVRAGDAVAGNGTVRTRLPSDVRSVAGRARDRRNDRRRAGRARHGGLWCQPVRRRALRRCGNPGLFRLPARPDGIRRRRHGGRRIRPAMAPGWSDRFAGSGRRAGRRADRWGHWGTDGRPRRGSERVQPTVLEGVKGGFGGCQSCRSVPGHGAAAHRRPLRAASRPHAGE